MNTIKISPKFKLESDFTTYARETIFTYQNGFVYYIDISDGSVFKIINVSRITNPIRCYYFDRKTYVYNFDEVAVIDYVTDEVTYHPMKRSGTKIIKEYFGPFQHILAAYDNGLIDIYVDCQLYKTVKIEDDLFKDADFLIPFATDFNNAHGIYIILKNSVFLYLDFTNNETYFVAELRGYKVGSAVYQAYPEYMYYNTIDGRLIKSDFRNQQLYLVNAKEVLNPSKKFMVLLDKENKILINGQHYPEMKPPFKLYGQHLDTLIIVDKENTLFRLESQKEY